MNARQDAWSAYSLWIARQPSLVVMQPTTLCNLDCRAYCYLPLRRQRHPMPVAVASAVAESLTALIPDEGAGGHVTEVCWHGGEPLAAGAAHLTALLAPFEPLRGVGALRHSVQTNATLLDDRWCALLSRYEFSVGVSIDGPASLNTRRADWAGRPAHDRIMAGISRLRDHGIGFSLIAVVGTSGTGRAEELLDFLAALGPASIGLNIEEFEGMNTGRQVSPDEARAFWADVIAWSATHPETHIRELGQLGRYLGTVRAGQRAAWEAHRFDPLPTVAFNGDVVLLSPELAGIRDDRYGDFIAGNVLRQSLAEILSQAWQLRYVVEFTHGLTVCQATCGFFDFCRGATAGNRYFENGDFASTETNYCRVSRQELLRATATVLRKQGPYPLAELLGSSHPCTADGAAASPGWDNEPAWDNWKKNNPRPWDNRPTWDNWKKNTKGK